MIRALLSPEARAQRWLLIAALALLTTTIALLVTARPASLDSLRCDVVEHDGARVERIDCNPMEEP